ncbi:MAG: HD domain-containing protein [bacterium]|nr:HD domain-containing protein [bacterium]
MTNKYKDTTGLLSEKIDPIIGIFFDFAQMKNLYRQGWLDLGVSRADCETDADHIFGVALMGYVIAKEHRPDLDAKKVMELGLFHELGEIFVGDLTPRDNISREERKRAEFEAVKKVFSKLSNPQKYIDVWLEYEHRKSPEAEFVTQIDKLELALQASVYEKVGYKNLDEFFTYYKERITSPELKHILDTIISNRK